MWNCRKCSQPVFFAERKQSLGFDWHPNCLRCEECGKRLNPGQHAEHKGVPFCHHPCYGALFGPQLFGHGTRNECHTSFGRVENRDGQIKRSHLESHLKAYNNFYEGKPGELKSREVNGRLILEGVLRIYWGVKNIIHLKEEDDSRMIATRRKSCIEHRINDTYGSDSDEDDPLWRDESPNRIMNRQISNPAERLNGEININSQTNDASNQNDNAADLPDLTATDHEGNEVPKTSTVLRSSDFQHTNGHCENDNGTQNPDPASSQNPGIDTNTQSPGSESIQYPRSDTSNQYSSSETSADPISDNNTHCPISETSIHDTRSETNTQYTGSESTTHHPNTDTINHISSSETDTKYPSETGTQYPSPCPVNNNQNRNHTERQERMLNKSGSTAIRRRPARRMEKSRLKRRCSINGHFYLRETSSFTPPFGSPCSIWITSKTTAEEVLNMLLEKYKVEMSAFNFALFVVRDTGELRRVKEDESPLVTRVMLGPHEDVAKVFIMDAQRTHEVSHEVAQFLNLSLAECRAILVQYEQEETRHLDSIKRKYDEMRIFIQNKINKCTVEITFPKLT